MGMRYVHIPMIAKKYPEEQVDMFLKLVNDPSTGKFFVHCAGGRHRTGVVGAVYRFNQYQWNYDQVYKEMKDYDFTPAGGMATLKNTCRTTGSACRRTRRFPLPERFRFK